MRSIANKLRLPSFIDLWQLITDRWPGKQSKDHATNGDKRMSLTAIMVSRGNKMKPVCVADIAYCYVLNRYVFIRIIGEDMDYLSAMSLDQLEQVMDGQHFFRVNRQLIANRHAIAHYSYIEHGKLEVALLPEIGTTIIKCTVSQRKAAWFKSWFEHGRWP